MPLVMLPPLTAPAAGPRSGPTLKIVPSRSPTYRFPSRSNAIPVATPIPSAYVATAPCGEIRYTVPSARELTYRYPSGPNASPVAFSTSRTNGRT